MKKLLASVAMIALLGAGCTPSSTQTPATPDSMQKPDGMMEGKMSMAQFLQGSWKIKSMQKVGGESQDVSALSLTLSFDGERMTGKVCNNLNGSYTVDDNKISFGPVISTKMFCQGLPGDVESAFSAGLESGYTMIKQGEDLVLQGSSVFVLEKN